MATPPKAGRPGAKASGRTAKPKTKATTAKAAATATPDGYTVEARREVYRGQRVSFVRAKSQG